MSNKRKQTVKTSKKEERRTSPLAYVPFIALVVIIALFILIPYMSPKQSFPVVEINQFTKVSDKGYSNNVQVYFITWYGSEDGAADSWVIYTALKNYGLFNVTPKYLIGNTTSGLIFNSFTPNTSIVNFKAIYVYGQFYNETPNGTIIPKGEYLKYALIEIKNEAPDWVYDLVLKYIVNGILAYGREAIEGISPANYTGVERMPTTLIISGPKGTWILIGYPEQFSPEYLKIAVNVTPNEFLNKINQGKIPGPLNDSATTLLQIVKTAY